jgi:benzodiazapine receptor
MSVTQPTNPRARRGLLTAAISVGLALAIGGIGSLATSSSVGSWYATLNKPSFNPPSAVFGPVWTALYILMALAAWRVWRSAAPDRQRRQALLLYGVQLALNLAWSLIFFGLQRPDLASVEIVVLLAAILATTAAFARIDRPAAWMMAPYIAWVSFATLLTFSIWRLN